MIVDVVVTTVFVIVCCSMLMLLMLLLLMFNVAGGKGRMLDVLKLCWKSEEKKIKAEHLNTLIVPSCSVRTYANIYLLLLVAPSANSGGVAPHLMIRRRFL